MSKERYEGEAWKWVYNKIKEGVELKNNKKKRPEIKARPEQFYVKYTSQFTNRPSDSANAMN